MNKKILVFSLVTISMIALVSAIAYYEVFSINLNVNQPISVDGTLEQSIDCNAGETCPGELITISNSADNERSIFLSDNSEDVGVAYVSELNLAQKNVDFNLDVWTLLEGGNTAVVEFTMVGDYFTAEVIDGGIEDYTLVYYKDNSERFVNPAEPIFIGDVVGNIPYKTDGNADEYNYCETEEYDTCHGGKLWYVPESAISEAGIDWTQASNFLFETSLIQFNAEGNIIVYPGSSISFTPIFDVGTYLLSGNVEIEITIA